jgi:ABC-2 type transport system permease protein
VPAPFTALPFIQTSAQTFAQALAVTRRILIEQARQPRSLFFWGLFPALMMLLFGLIYSHNEAMRVGLDATPAGILIGAALFFSCLGGTMAIVVGERERGTLRRLLISPLQPVAYFLGIVLALLVVAALQAVVVFATAWPLGARYQGSVWLGALVVLLSVFSYVGIGFFFAARFARRAEDLNGPLAALGVPLLVLGGTFFPLSLMPDFLVAVARVNPVLHLSEALKAVAGRGAGLQDIAPELVFLALFSGAALALGALSYRRLLRDEALA